jgi:hypothetical protein
MDVHFGEQIEWSLKTKEADRRCHCFQAFRPPETPMRTAFPPGLNVDNRDTQELVAIAAAQARPPVPENLLT